MSGPHSPYRTGATAVSARSREFPKIRATAPPPPAALLSGVSLLCAAIFAPVPGWAADGSDANPPADRAAEPADLPPAARVLAAARSRLDGAATISATLVQTVSLGPAVYRATGSFAAADGRSRVELTSADGPSLLQVCDGEVLRTQYTLGGETAVTRRNVRAVREAAADAPNPPLAGALALGGLSGLLATLEMSMKWRPAVRQEIDGAGFVVLDGRWTRASRRDLNARFGGSVPAFLPDGAKVYLDAARLVPRRVLYWVKDDTTPEGRRTLMSLDFTDVRLGAPLPPDLFAYAPPPDADEDDVTAKAVARLAALGEGDGADDDADDGNPE